MSSEAQDQATTLKRRLTDHGIVVLAVTEDSSEPGWFTVYLHWPAMYLHPTLGPDQEETAFWFLVRLDGVLEVRVSDLTPTIVRVRQRPDVSGCA